MDSVCVVGGHTFVTLERLDRGFAHFCDTDMKQSAPLKHHSWLNDAMKARNDIVKIALDKVAAEHLVGHKPGS
jgi:hypothetical protein